MFKAKVLSCTLKERATWHRSDDTGREVSCLDFALLLIPHAYHGVGAS